MQKRLTWHAKRDKNEVPSRNDQFGQVEQRDRRAAAQAKQLDRHSVQPSGQARGLFLFLNLDPYQATACSCDSPHAVGSR